MGHYSEEEWLRYKKRELAATVCREMEEHLASCEQCLQVFLSLLDQAEIEAKGKLLSPGFTAEVLKKVGMRGKRTAKEKLADTFIYYAAAACLTLILVSSGVFHSFVEKGFAAPEHLSLGCMQKRSLGFPDKIANMTALWIENFETERWSKDEEK